MYKFSLRSREKMQGVHPDIVSVLEEAIKLVDFTVLEGVRGEERQKLLVTQGKSKTLNSKHLKQSDGYSHAVDVAPWPIDWQDEARFAYMAGIIVGIAANRGVSLRWGHDWDSDGDMRDQSFNDSPHFELRVN